MEILSTLQHTLASQLRFLDPQIALTVSFLALAVLVVMRFVFGVARMFVNLASLILLLIAVGGGVYVYMAQVGGF